MTSNAGVQSFNRSYLAVPNTYQTTVNSSRRWDFKVLEHQTSTRVQCRGQS